ncbi:hypothetical protein M0802_005246 [Mischocyttarus mexicanus]|nr:hypothetical protein M0802_005246 [Mischocyttarus mexicanus]
MKTMKRRQLRRRRRRRQGLMTPEQVLSLKSALIAEIRPLVLNKALHSSDIRINDCQHTFAACGKVHPQSASARHIQYSAHRNRVNGSKPPLGKFVTTTRKEGN